MATALRRPARPRRRGVVPVDADQVHVYRLGDDRTYGVPTVILDDGVLGATAFPEFALPAAEALAIPQ